jgi:hypothetical protein
MVRVDVRSGGSYELTLKLADDLRYLVQHWRRVQRALGAGRSGPKLAELGLLRRDMRTTSVRVYTPTHDGLLVVEELEARASGRLNGFTLSMQGETRR